MQMYEILKAIYEILKEIQEILKEIQEILKDIKTNKEIKTQNQNSLTPFPPMGWPDWPPQSNISLLWPAEEPALLWPRVIWPAQAQGFWGEAIFSPLFVCYIPESLETGLATLLWATPEIRGCS